MDQERTNLQAPRLAEALIASTFDQDLHAKNAISNSLSFLGKKQPELVANSIHDFLIKHPKIEPTHRVLLLTCLSNIIDGCSDLKLETVKKIVLLASEYLTNVKKANKDFQNATSDLLATLGKCYIKEVIEELRNKFVAGHAPHHLVIHTLGRLAIADVPGMMNHIEYILHTTVTLLNLVKNDSLRIAFSLSLANFSESISEYCSNPEVLENFDLNMFSHDLNEAFNVLFTSWLQTRDYKVQSAVVEALGKMILLLSSEKVEANGPKLAVALITMYKKSPDPLPITTALGNVVTAVTQKESPVLEPVLESLIATLHYQVCNTTFKTETPETEKNFSEVLRCFGILASSYSGIIIGMILQRAEVRDERIRAGNLLIIKHLINSNPTAMKNDQDMIITGFLKHLNDPSNQVTYNMAKLVVAMGTHGYLHRVGGSEYVHFIVRQCSLSNHSAPSKTPQTVTNEQLRDMCDDILNLLTTTVEDSDKVLWPYLFEFVANGSFTNSLGVITRSLSILAKRKRVSSSSESVIDFEHFANIPQPTGLLSRFLVMLSHPLQKRTHPEAALSLIQNLAGNLHENLPKLLDEEIPTIVNFLAEHSTTTDTWVQEEWEKLLLKSLSTMLDVIDSEEWTCSLGQALTSQWPLYENFPEYKKFAFQCLGAVLEKTRNKEFVESYLVLLFMSINHGNPLERQGSAICVGKCASCHLDATLEKLNEFIKLNITKKESSYLRILKSERSITEVEQTKGTAALCCGYIAFHAPSDLIASRIEINIIKNITALFKNVKNANIKIDLTKSVDLIAKSLDPLHFNNSSSHPRYVFTARERLITKLLSYLKDDIPTEASELKAAILQTCASLVTLDPPLRDTDEATMTKITLEHVIPIQAPQDNANPVLVTTCVSNMNKLLEEVLRKRPNSSGFNAIFKHLEPYLTSEVEHVRKRAIQFITEVLAKFNSFALKSKTNNTLSNMGLLMARLLPCTCDAAVEVRLEALTCIRQLVCVHNNSIDVASEGDGWFEGIGEKLISEDNQSMYEAVAELTKVVCLKLPSNLTQFYPGSLTVCLLDALSWPQQTTSNAACLALRHIFESRGSIFANNITEIVVSLIGKLPLLLGEDKSFTKDGVLQLLCILAQHHLHASLNTLLSSQLPYSEVVSMCWLRLGVDRVKEAAFEYLLDQLDRSLPYDEALKQKGKPKQSSTKTATLPSLAIASALHLLVRSFSETFHHNDGQAMTGHHHRLLAASLVRLGSMLDVKTPPKLAMDPYRQAVAFLKTVLTSCCGRKMNLYLTQECVWETLDNNNGPLDFTKSINCIVIGLCVHQFADIPHIVSCLNNYLPSIYEMQRVTVVAFFAQLVKEQSGRNEVLLEIVMNSLRSRLVDAHRYVRQLCITGLSNVVYASQDQIERYSTSVLSAMMAGMDDNDDPTFAITLSAMSGLARFLRKVKQANIHSIFVNICLRARPCFEKGDGRVRAAAFQLFGALARFARDDLESSFVEQVHSNLVSILLHLNDGDVDVQRVCKATLKEIGPRLSSKSVDEMFQKHLIDESQLHYGEFMNDLAKIMVVDLSEKINFYVMDCVSFYKSQWPSVRSNAAMFSGFVLNSLSEENQATINREHVCAALIQLLKDSSPEVRGKAAEAMSLLHGY